MQDQSTTTAGRRPSGTAPSTMYDSAAMERQVRQVKGSGIMAPAQVIGNRIKPGSMSNPHQQNRSGVGAAAVGGVTSNQVLKCPRCNSLNTKFCYYNNYSLLQPRHFCKNCRRYWTKGGALRNVPVGGGCRKNKRTAATVATSGSGTSAVTAVLATATTMTTSSPGSVTKQGSMNMMMIRENSASCRNSSMSAVHKAALQESMPPAITYTNFPSLYSYTSKNGQIQPANSLSNPAASFYNPTDQSNPTQYPLLNPRLSPFLPPNQASFHSFLSLKQAISSLAAPNHDLLSFNPSLTPTSALPFLSNDHHNISTANLDAAFHVPSNDPLMGLDLINASTTAPLVPLSSVTTTHSTTSASYSAAQSSSLALPEGFNHTNDLANRRRDHQLDGILHDTNDHKMNARYIKNQQELLQPFGSSSSAAGARVMQEMHAAASTGMQDMHAGMREMHAGSVEAMQDMHGAAAAIMEEGHQLMQLMSSSSMKDELVSDNFKMKGDNEDDINQSAGARGTNVSWEGTHRSSFLEASGDDQVYWSCNPTTWPDDLST